jgi:predicted DNA-binding transcriptional regulator AlpA
VIKSSSKKTAKAAHAKAALSDESADASAQQWDRHARAPDRTPRLLDRHDVISITGVTFPTIWAWMRAGKFPRSRICGGKSMWLSTEVDEWMAALPIRPLKGDDENHLLRR